MRWTMSWILLAVAWWMPRGANAQAVSMYSAFDLIGDKLTISSGSKPV